MIPEPQIYHCSTMLRELDPDLFRLVYMVIQTFHELQRSEKE